MLYFSPQCLVTGIVTFSLVHVPLLIYHEAWTLTILKMAITSDLILKLRVFLYTSTVAYFISLLYKLIPYVPCVF